MGDYVDKGPTAKQVVEFVKDLTTTFPTKVTAILGNHELELLRDRDARITPEERYSASLRTPMRWMGQHQVPAETNRQEVKGDPKAQKSQRHREQKGQRTG